MPGDAAGSADTSSADPLRCRGVGPGRARHRPPCVGDVTRDDRQQERHDGHHAQREAARRGVADRERRLHVGQRGVVGRVVPSRGEQQGQHRCDASRAARPQRAAATARSGRHAPCERGDASRGKDRHEGHLAQVEEQLALHEGDGARCGIGAVACGVRHPCEKESESREKERGGRQRPPACALAQRGVGHGGEEVVAGQQPREEDEGQAERRIAVVGQRLQAVPGRCPPGDEEVAVRSGHAEAVHHEGRSGEERAERRAQQKGRARAADRQHGVVGPASVEAALPAAESERRGLHHEEEEERQPHVACAAETDGVEEWKRREEGAAEDDERREGQLPFVVQRREECRALRLGACELRQQPLAALHEEQEDQHRPQQRDQKPPVVLQENERIHDSILFGPVGAPFDLSEHDA